MSTITKVLADNLRRLRKEHEMTQANLAEAIDVSLASVQNYESERIWPSIDTVIELAKVFKIKDVELFRDPEFKPGVETVLLEFGRLLSQANPLTVKHALQILEIGQPSESQSVAQTPRKRIAKS